MRFPSMAAGRPNSAAALLLCCAAFAAAAAEPLPALRAQASGTTVSGVSSGAYMAVQMHVAHSATVAGAGVIAGGPYYCAQGSVFTAFYNCMTPGWWTPLPRAAALKAETDALSLSRQIDSVRHLENSRAWLFSGSNDHTVYREVVEGLRDFYAGYKVQVTLVTDKPAGHAMVTEVRGNKCGSSEPPFIVDCDYDAAGVLLQSLLGKLNPRAEKETGRLVRFDQSPYGNEDVSMDATGFVYIPQRCEKERCRIHIVFHGCRQGASDVGDEFVRYAGYNAWADTNNLIVLYPQVIKRFSPFTWNPRGCWDWWGYTGLDYHTQSGAQIRAVKGMIDRLAGG
ncbi:MAG TPA: depolymerase [Burkholderiales bacterium]|nr:depolymerase [Burkholderiales bacterium]